MIYDKLERAQRYMGLSPRLDRALSMIGAFVSRYQPTGRLDGDGDALYANCMHYTSSLDPEKLWESHRDYLDVHLVVRGAERVQLTDGAQARMTAEYDPAVEAALYRADADVSVPLDAGSFAVFFPGEIHRAGMAAAQPEEVCKIVIKVRADADE